MSLSLILQDGKLLVETGALVAGDPNLDGFGNCCCGVCCVSCKDFTRGAGACEYEYEAPEPGQPGPPIPAPWGDLPAGFRVFPGWGAACLLSGIVYKIINENGECLGDCTKADFQNGVEGCTPYDMGIGCEGCGLSAWDQTDCYDEDGVFDNTLPDCPDLPQYWNGVICLRDKESEEETPCGELIKKASCTVTMCGATLKTWQELEPSRLVEAWNPTGCYNSRVSDLENCETCGCYPDGTLETMFNDPNVWSNTCCLLDSETGLWNCSQNPCPDNETQELSNNFKASLSMQYDDRCGTLIKKEETCEPDCDSPFPECSSSSASSSSSSSYSPGGGE